MIKSTPILLFVLLLTGCDGIENADTRICDVVSEAHLDISPEPRELQIKIKRCDTKGYELDVSLQDKAGGKGWSLIKKELVDTTSEPTISGLGIRLSKTEFREYTLHLPSYVAIDKHMSLSAINSKMCLELKEINLCFGQSS